MDKQKFIDAGRHFIYELDEHPVSSVNNQIAKEFNEILDLNDPGVLHKRKEYFGIGEDTNTALRSGQKIFSQELFVEI